MNKKTRKCQSNRIFQTKLESRNLLNRWISKLENENHGEEISRIENTLKRHLKVTCHVPPNVDSLKNCMKEKKSRGKCFNHVAVVSQGISQNTVKVSPNNNVNIMSVKKMQYYVDVATLMFFKGCNKAHKITSWMMVYHERLSKKDLSVEQVEEI